MRISRRRFLVTAGLAGLGAGLPVGHLEAGGQEEQSIPILNGAVARKELNLKFLFQGDSITDGKWGRDQRDLNHYLGHGYVFAIASRLGADFPNAGFQFTNRGMSGHRLSDLEKRWKKDTLDHRPDVLSILVGVNDLNALQRKKPDAYTAKEFDAHYRQLLDETFKSNPALLLVLAPPFMYKVGARIEQWAFWEKELAPRAEIVRRLAKDYNAVFVDYPALFARAIKIAPVEYWLWDGCHPSVFGHELMAREWIRSVSSRLSFLKKYTCVA
jgi:lysophospholipase L1-like esterase